MEYLYFVYIISNSHRSVFYTGVTNNMSNRIRQHETGQIQGFSKKYNCTDLLYYEKYVYVYEAIAREKQIKKYSNKKKRALIESSNIKYERLNEKVYSVDKEQL